MDRAAPFTNVGRAVLVGRAVPSLFESCAVSVDRAVPSLSVGRAVPAGRAVSLSSSSNLILPTVYCKLMGNGNGQWVRHYLGIGPSTGLPATLLTLTTANRCSVPLAVY